MLCKKRCKVRSLCRSVGVCVAILDTRVLQMRTFTSKHDSKMHDRKPDARSCRSPGASILWGGKGKRKGRGKGCVMALRGMDAPAEAASSANLAITKNTTATRTLLSAEARPIRTQASKPSCGDPGGLCPN